MIDFDGYRPNVGIVICNKHGQVLWAKRFGQNSWQFPQGGINEGENIETAMYRELYEEVGLQKKDVRLLWASKYWLKYKLPKRLVRAEGSGPVCIGQKQRWFLLQLISDESQINLKITKNPEFDGWRWVSFWYPVRQVVAFKRDVYRKAMKEFASVLQSGIQKKSDDKQSDKTRLERTEKQGFKPKRGQDSKENKSEYRKSYHRPWYQNNQRGK
ncbi:RNA pyrophosphohydrolase [Mannheimia sp. AT1]|uniref:RNA pyrophosphohydrolase n=1 Tax=Mannheimia cairinae TaxID=3025936 RepID=A0ABT5MR34_9PAST|nr:RNA pyrophosphohydrolase [Mannheimia cairinae]MDD0827152.1 RNA pyrophosphohydrolase [Mannheimia cairinae]